MVDRAGYLKMVPSAKQKFPDPFSFAVLPVLPGPGMMPGPLPIAPSLPPPHPADIPEDDLLFCSPVVFGYSFSLKKWGRFLAGQFSPIVWNPMAFEHLVLSERKKTLIKSVVFSDRSKWISDVVKNKAGGSIIVLHGKPGTGKTLTAEAVSELSKRPLMVLSAAEHSFQAPQLEAALSTLLELCKMWNAMLLIDEAEVFLEARSLGDIERNALVSVLLRLLEYHQEVIFMTTNYIARLDAAIKSRISIAIRYPSLDETAREEIWRRFLTMADVAVVDDKPPDALQAITQSEVKKLAAKNMNGR
jgi:hypothetical protein